MTFSVIKRLIVKLFLNTFLIFLWEHRSFNNTSENYNRLIEEVGMGFSIILWGLLRTFEGLIYIYVSFLLSLLL